MSKMTNIVKHSLHTTREAEMLMPKGYVGNYHQTDTASMSLALCSEAFWNVVWICDEIYGPESL